MIITFTTYYIIIGVVTALIFSVPLYNRFVKGEGAGKDYFYFLALIWFPVNWYTPAIYTITDCDVYTKEILIFPKTVQGYDLKNGWCNYIINKSQRRITLFDEVYGNVDEEDIARDVIIEPGTMYKAPFVHLDYIFQKPPNSVSTKKGGDIKHRVACLKKKNNEDE